VAGQHRLKADVAEHELAQEGAVHAVLHLACQSKDRACYDCEILLERLDARAAVKKKSDNNVVL
jgi:hypothetical protein